VAAQYLLPIFVVWHKHARSLNPPDMRQEQEPAVFFEELTCAILGCKNLRILNILVCSYLKSASFKTCAF